MNTPAHLLIGMASFGRVQNRQVTGAALAGAIAPDLSLYLMASWALFVADIPPQVVFDQLYYSTPWQRVFAIDNSFILWGIALTFALWAKAARAIAFCAAGFLHLALDFPLHNHDARMHFWPASDWVYVSPFSYWDSAYHADIIGPIELGLCAFAVYVLVKRHKYWLQRTGLALLALAEMAVGGVFRLIF